MWSTVPTKIMIFCSRLVCIHCAGPPLKVWLCVSVVSGIRTMQLFSIRQKVEVFISALSIRIITDGECQVENYDKVSKVSRDTKKLLCCKSFYISFIYTYYHRWWVPSRELWQSIQSIKRYKKTFVLHYNYLVAVVHQTNATLHWDSSTSKRGSLGAAWSLVTIAKARKARKTRPEARRYTCNELL